MILFFVFFLQTCCIFWLAVCVCVCCSEEGLWHQHPNILLFNSKIKKPRQPKKKNWTICAVYIQSIHVISMCSVLFYSICCYCACVVLFNKYEYRAWRKCIRTHQQNKKIKLYCTILGIRVQRTCISTSAGGGTENELAIFSPAFFLCVSLFYFNFFCSLFALVAPCGRCRSMKHLLCEHTTRRVMTGAAGEKIRSFR